MSTTPLLPPYPTTLPLYLSIEDLLRDLWEKSMRIEEDFYQGNAKENFELNILKIQYWESVKMCIDKEAYP